MHHLQTERKKERKAENQLSIIQLEVEDDIDGQTNGRQQEWNVNMVKKKRERAGHNTSGSIDLCNSSIRSQSLRNTQALKDMSGSRNVEVQEPNSSRKLEGNYFLKNHQLFDPEDFHRHHHHHRGHAQDQFAKYQTQEQYGHSQTDQLMVAAQNHHLAQYHYQEQPNNTNQMELYQKQGENTDLLNQNQTIELVDKEINRLSDNDQVYEDTGLRRDCLKSSFANINIDQFNELIMQQEEQQEEQTNLINQKFFKMIKNHNEVFNSKNANLQNQKSYFGTDSEYDTVLSQNNKKLDNQFFNFDLQQEKYNLRPLTPEAQKSHEHDIKKEVSSMVRQILGHQQMMCLKHISESRKKTRTKLSPPCIRFQNMLKRKMTDFQNYIIQNKDLQNQIYLDNVKQIYKQKSGNKEGKNQSMKSDKCVDANQANGASVRNGNNTSPQQREFDRIFSIENQPDNIHDQNQPSDHQMGQYANELQETAKQNNQNNIGKPKANQSSCNDSFDMLNFEIQNKIKEGQVLPQDSASQFGLKSSVKDDFDSSHGELQVNEGYQSLKELPPYSIFANQMDNSAQDKAKKKLEQSATSLLDSNNQMEQFSDKAGPTLNQGAQYNIQQCTSELSINNLDSSTHMNQSTENCNNSINQSQNQLQSKSQNQMLHSPSDQINNDKTGFVHQQLFQPQQFNPEFMMQFNQQIKHYPQQISSPNLSSSDDKSPGIHETINSQIIQSRAGVAGNNKQPQQQQQPLVMNLGSLSQKQFKQMDKEQQRLQMAMIMRLTEQQVQAQAFAIARQQLQQRQNNNMPMTSVQDCGSIDMKSNKSKMSQASSHKSKQSKKQSKQGQHQANQSGQNTSKQNKQSNMIPQQSGPLNNQEMLQEVRVQQQAALNTLNGQQWMTQCSPMQFPNPFVPPNQYKEYIQYQQFQQFQQFQKLKEQVNRQQQQQQIKNINQVTHQTKGQSFQAQDTASDQQLSAGINENYHQTPQQRHQNNYPQQTFGIPGAGMMTPPMYGTSGGYMQPNQMMGTQQPYGPVPFGVQDLQQYQMQMAQQLEAQLIQYNKLQNLHGGFNGQFIPFRNSQQMESSVNSSSKLSQVSHSDTSRASQQTNRTNQTITTNQTNLTNITSCKNVKKLNAQIQGQQSAYYQKQNNNKVHYQSNTDQNKESQHSGRNQKKGTNEFHNSNKGGPGQNQAQCHQAVKPKNSNTQMLQDGSKAVKFEHQSGNIPMDAKMMQPTPLQLRLTENQRPQGNYQQTQLFAANQNFFGMPQIIPQASPQTATNLQNIDGNIQDHQALQGANGLGCVDYKGQNQQNHLRSSMQSFNNNNLNQSQMSALSSCSSNYNSRAESNSISHSVSSSNISTSQQQRMIKNRVSGMQHPQPPFMPFATPMIPQQQQSQMNSKQNQSASKLGNMMMDPQTMPNSMQATPQGHMQLQSFIQMSPGGVPFQSPGLLAQECSPQQHTQQVYTGDQQQQLADLQMQQQQKGKVMKKTAAMSEFNQIYKQIQNEKDRKKFLLQNAYALSKEHQGCRRLQKKIDEEIQRGNHGFCEDLLNVLIDFFYILMVDQFANYLCQKLIKIAKPAQLDRILTNIKQDFVQIATDQRGTRPLQKLLDKLYPLNQERSQLLSEAIKHNVLDLSINIHGNHVVQTCLEMLLSPAHKEPIYETVINNSLQIARDKQGCCVMETCLKSGSVQQQKRLIQEVVKNLREFIVDEYANYVVQEVITFKDPAINYEIAKIVSQNLQLYCNSKFSSSVVEILINNSNYDCQLLIYDAFMDKSNFTNKKRNAFREIMLNQFGNYAISTIIQKAFEFPNKKYIKFFIKIFRENTEYLKKINFGKKFINKIDQMVLLQQQIQAHSSPYSSGHNQSTHLQDPRQAQQQQQQPRYDKYFVPATASFTQGKMQLSEQDQSQLEGQMETQTSQLRVSNGEMQGELSEFVVGAAGSRLGSGGNSGGSAPLKSMVGQGSSSNTNEEVFQETKMPKYQKNNLGSSDDVEEEDEVVASLMNAGGSSTLDQGETGGNSEALQGQVASASPLVHLINGAQGSQTDFRFYLNNPAAVQDCASNPKKNSVSYSDVQDINN